MSVAFVALAACVLPAHAAGPYDGSWYVDAPATGQDQPTQEASGCEALRIPFTVTDNRVSGSLQHDIYREGLEPGDGGPVPLHFIGTVQADGTLTAEWQTRQFTGRLSSDNAELSWTGECGARVATSGRAG